MSLQPERLTVQYTTPSALFTVYLMLYLAMLVEWRRKM